MHKVRTMADLMPMALSPSRRLDKAERIIFGVLGILILPILHKFKLFIYFLYGIGGQTSKRLA